MLNFFFETLALTLCPQLGSVLKTLRYYNFTENKKKIKTQIAFALKPNNVK